MILTLRLHLIAILVTWQVFPALAHTDWNALPRWAASVSNLGDTEDSRTAGSLRDNLSDPAEIVNERANLNGLPLALMPELASGIAIKGGSFLFMTNHWALTGSRAFLYRDRGPPRLLPS